MIMAAALCFLIVVSLGFFYHITKRTFLRIDLGSGYVWPLQMYREFIMISSGALLPLIYGPQGFEGVILNGSAEQFFSASLMSVYALFALVFTLGVLARFVSMPIGRENLLKLSHDKRISRFVNASLLAGFSVFVFSYFFLSYTHALIESIFAGSSLLAARLSNAYSSRLPSQLASVISFSWIIGAVYLGILLHGRKFKLLMIYGVLVFFLASARGDKAPMIQFIVLAALSFFALRGLTISLNTIIRTLFIFVPSIYFALYFLVSLQSVDLTIESFNVYLFNRLGVGQMAGVFETLSIQSLDGDYFWHIVPFASFFVDYIPYDKALMMATEGFEYNEMGVKNSFFISEAYGIGGYALVFFSPFVVAFSFILGVYLLNLFLKIFFSPSIAAIFVLPLHISTSAFTGGFSSFPLFKGLILTFFCLGFIWIFYLFLRLSFVKR